MVGGSVRFRINIIFTFWVCVFDFLGFIHSHILSNFWRSWICCLTLLINSLCSLWLSSSSFKVFWEISLSWSWPWPNVFWPESAASVSAWMRLWLLTAMKLYHYCQGIWSESFCIWPCFYLEIVCLSLCCDLKKKKKKEKKT